MTTQTPPDQLTAGQPRRSVTATYPLRTASARGRATLTALVAALTCGITISACGGSIHTSTGAADPLLAASQCMRAHGVPNFPDPGRRNGSEGMSIVSGPDSSTETIQGIPFSGPAFQAAAKTCKLLSGGGGVPPQETESYQLAALHFAHCMRAQGVPNYPDPNPPSSDPQSGDGPQIDKNAPAVRQAAKTCNKHQPTNGRGF